MTAIVIVSFGRLVLMQRTLDTLLNTDLKETTLTVVDNNSQLATRELLLDYQNYIDNLVFLRNNRGKPYAWNLGARIAQEQCCVTNLVAPKYFLFCDNDLEFKLDWHNKLITAYEEHKDLPLCALSGTRWPSHKLDGLQRGLTTQINVVRFPPGCCVFISAEAFRVNGPWDTHRLIRTVDTRYFRNAQHRGYKNASIHPENVINHTGGKKGDRSWDGTGKPKLLP